MQQPLEQAVAETILQRFESFYSRFLEITQGSKSRFENSDWLGVQLAGRERIRLYDHHVGATASSIRQMMGGAPRHPGAAQAGQKCLQRSAAPL